ncbi:MAG: hypothetical protein JO061_14305 [Acidobacteriaceae bacterium]|nr:hypothetical protein [Acidobacteriaceae bacterium]
MINTEAFDVSTCELKNVHSYLLSKNIAAIQVLPADGSAEPRLGMITQLPRGAELRFCGEGFNGRTVKVRWGDGYYFVFLQDLEEPKTFAAVS